MTKREASRAMMRARATIAACEALAVVLEAEGVPQGGAWRERDRAVRRLHDAKVAYGRADRVPA